MSVYSRFYRHLWTRLSAFLIIVGLVGAACNLGVAPVTPTPRVTPTSSQRPIVSIQAPQNGADAVVGQAITVAATGSHPDGITRMELQANGLQADSKVSQNASGDQQFSAFLNYTPTVTGTLVLQVVAYRGNLASDPVTISVNVKDQAAQITATVAAPSGPTAPVYTDPTCRARIDVNGLNFRQGPGQNYPPLSVLGLGTSVVVTGRTNDLTWWQGRIGSTLGWMSASFITLFGSLCNVVPLVQAPASPVPSVTVTNTPAATVMSATTASGLPDLVVTKIEGPVSIILDANNTKTATYKVTIMNSGATAAGAFDAGMVLPDGTLRDIGAVTGLAPNQQAVFQTDITFAAPGSARITAVADMNQVVTESDESDNLRNYDVVLIKPTPMQQAITPTP